MRGLPSPFLPLLMISSRCIPSSRSSKVNPSRGFTLIELVLVVTVIALLAGLIGLRMGTFTYMREERFVRQLMEHLTFLHRQAVVDQSFYQLEIDIDDNSYRIGLFKPDTDVNTNLSNDVGSEGGTLTLELADLLSPDMGEGQTMIAPPSFPSLNNPHRPPPKCSFSEVRTMRSETGGLKGGKARIFFSPKGFSEFAVIYLGMSGGNTITLLVNPFTGIPEMFRGFREFEWTFGKKK